MITVAVLINGKLLFAKSAVRVSSKANGVAQYRLEDNVRLEHRVNDGAIRLATLLLATIPDDTVLSAEPAKGPCILFPDKPET